MRYSSWHLKSKTLFCLFALTSGSFVFLSEPNKIAIAQNLPIIEHQVDRLPNRTPDPPRDRQELRLQERRLQFRQESRQQQDLRQLRRDIQNRSRQQELRSDRRQNQEAALQRNEIRRLQRNNRRQRIILPPR